MRAESLADNAAVIDIGIAWLREILEKASPRSDRRAIACKVSTAPALLLPKGERAG
jgi:hypothetical protein